MRLAALVVFSAVGLGGGAARAADVTAVTVIDAVTIFPSGAEVTRLAKVKLAPGEQRVVFGGLPSQAIASSIRVEGKATGKLEIGSVDTRHIFVSRTEQSATDRRKLEDQLELLRDTRALYEGEVHAAELQRTLLTNLAGLPTVTPGAQNPGSAPIDWKALLVTIGQGSSEAKRAELEGRAKVRETDRQMKDVQGKLAAFAPNKDEQTEVTVTVVADGMIDADMTVRYQVPGASWTAFYDARLATGSKTVAPKLDLTRRASIMQTTGEAWTNVTLALSTTRPTLGASAPDLASISVDYQPDAPPPPPAAPAAPQVMRRMSKSAPMGGIADTLESADAQMAPAASALAGASERNADVMQAAFQAVYVVPGRASVLPTGEAKRVQLMEESVEPQMFVRSVPKLDPKAYLYAKLVLPKSSTVLPGAVSLFRDGTFVGTGKLPLLAAGEEHDLGFGTDDAVRVKYAIAEDKRGEKGMISSSKTDTRAYKISVKNMHERPMMVTIYDHIPVSQQQDIKVTLTGRTPPTKSDIDDKRGVIAWESKLDADQEQVIEFGYQVIWPGAKAITYR